MRPSSPGLKAVNGASRLKPRRPRIDHGPGVAALIEPATKAPVAVDAALLGAVDEDPEAMKPFETVK
jgi:hypothetical protein